MLATAITGSIICVLNGGAGPLNAALNKGSVILAQAAHVTFAGAGGSIVVILTVVAALLAALLVALLATAWSCVRSSFEKGRRKGLELAADEILRGAQVHFGSRDAAIPKAVVKTLALHKRTIAHPALPCEPALWEVGNAVGEACWRNGYGEGANVGAKPDDMIRLDLSLAELLQMSWLAHLGFQHMMPNYRGIEVHRFSGPDDASEGARSVALLECALPRSERPFADLKTQIIGREKLISDWWTTAVRVSA